jgi:hypothetical protein
MRYTLIICLLLCGCGAVKDEDEARFRKDLGKMTITVYPAVVRGMGESDSPTWDGQAAKEIAGWIESKGLAKTEISSQSLQIAAKPSVNQARMFKSSMTSFAAWAKADPPKTDYACVAEYLMMRNGKVGGVHVYFIRSDGVPAFGTLSNSHWEEFKAVNPASVPDATRVAIGSLNRQLVGKK